MKHKVKCKKNKKENNERITPKETAKKAVKRLHGLQVKVEGTMGLTRDEDWGHKTPKYSNNLQSQENLVCVFGVHLKQQDKPQISSTKTDSDSLL